MTETWVPPGPGRCGCGGKVREVVPAMDGVGPEGRICDTCGWLYLDGGQLDITEILRDSTGEAIGVVTWSEP